MKNWIKIEDALPELKPCVSIHNHQESEPCIVIIKGQSHEIAKFTGSMIDDVDDEEYYRNWFCEMAGDCVDNVTHWMYAPEIPKNLK